MSKEEYIVPVDIMTDVARIILQGGLEHRLTDAGKETVTLEIGFQPDKLKSKYTIEQMINDYNFFRYQDNENEL